MSSRVWRLPELFVGMQHKSSLHSPNDRFVIALHSPVGNLQTGLPVGPPEKRAAELAFWVQQGTFSKSGLGAKYAELRRFAAIFRGKLQGFSAVETCWRRERDSNFSAYWLQRKLLISSHAKRGKTGKNAYRRHNLGTSLIQSLHPTALASHLCQSTVLLTKQI